MMTVLPFICLGTGIILGLFVKNKSLADASDKVSTIALVLLMLSIGISIGIDKSIISEFPVIGFNCVVIAISAISFSVLFTLICERSVMPLKTLEKKMDETATGSDQTVSGDPDHDENTFSHLVWIMPVSLVTGLFTGILMRNIIKASLMEYAFIVALIILYICVGISQGANKEIFKYLKLLGLRVLWLPAAVLCGSILGGFVPSLFLDVPAKISVISASGMSFYSITGAFMTQSFGLAYGTYGFIVNVLREFITILTMPLLIRISPGSPIAGGAAGDMDTMLAPVTKFVGPRLSLVTLLNGTILTFAVPILLPLLARMF